MHFAETGSNGATTSMKDLITASASLGTALSGAAAEMSTQFGDLSTQTAAQLSEAVTARAEIATTLATSIQAAVQQATEAVTSATAACAAVNASHQDLVASHRDLVALLVPSKPAVMSLLTGPNDFRLNYTGVDSSVAPFNFTVQVAGFENHTAGNPQWIEQHFPIAAGDMHGNFDITLGLFPRLFVFWLGVWRGFCAAPHAPWYAFRLVAVLIGCRLVPVI